jgi:hypothetical protein
MKEKERKREMARIREKNGGLENRCYQVCWIEVVTIWSPKWGLAGRGEPETLDNKSAPGGTRTPNLLIRSQTLYPLSYRRVFSLII